MTKKTKWGIGGAIVLLAVIVVVAIVTFLGSNKTEENAQSTLDGVSQSGEGTNWNEFSNNEGTTGMSGSEEDGSDSQSVGEGFLSDWTEDLEVDAGENVSPEEGKIVIVGYNSQPSYIVWSINSDSKTANAPEGLWSKEMKVLPTDRVVISVGGDFSGEFGGEATEQNGYCKIYSGLEVVDEQFYSGASESAVCGIVVP